MNTVLQTLHLSKTFRDFWRRPKVRAVDDVSLSITSGEVFGLLGPNGSGKSTTIKMMLGLLHPTSGSVQYTIRGTTFTLQNASIASIVRERIGYLPELSRLYNYLTPRETLHFYGGLFNLPAKLCRERTNQLLETVGIADAADRAVGEFSKGMARRVGLAQALINDPDIIILDEPTSGLDPIGRHHVKNIIRDLARQGKAVLLSSHLLEEVENVCDRIAILHHGQLRAEGKLEEILVGEDGKKLSLEDYFLRVMQK